MINNIIGRPVSKTGVTVGYTLLMVSLILIYKFGLASIILSLVALVMISLYEGIQIDPERRKFRTYFSFLLMKSGKWKDLDAYPYLCLLRKNKEQPLGFGNSTMADISIRCIQYEICLLNESHYERILVKILDEKEDALSVVNEYSRVLNKPIVDFHPRQISTRRR